MQLEGLGKLKTFMSFLGHVLSVQGCAHLGYYADGSQLFRGICYSENGGFSSFEIYVNLATFPSISGDQDLILI
jgi:hypothetical protein